MILLKLFIEFFKIGVFAVGGGMATIPFLQELGQRTGWFSDHLITDMIAISESTPGPIGINMATYVGYNTAGMTGGIIATLGIVVPAVVIVIFVSKSLEKFSSNKQVDYMFYGLRPAVTGLIAAAGFDVFRLAVIRLGGAAFTLAAVPWGRLAYFVLIFFLIRKYKKHPIVYIACSAIVGIAAAPLLM